MSTYISVYRCDIMNFVLLGYLYFYIAINPVESSDSHISIEITKQQYDIENCTQCNFKLQSCRCWQSNDNCLVCCTDSCCTCNNCTLCRYKREQTIMTEIIVSISLGCGIIGLIIIYCKMCYRTRRISRRRCIVLQQECDNNDTTVYCNTIEHRLRERPPPYSETIHGVSSVYTSFYNNAPPLYTSPYNKLSMQEAPPSYPGTPKSQERSRDSNESSSPPSVVQYI